MSSSVDICNLALSHLGDAATVASIDPPEGSQQAEHCQRFYPVARDAMLDVHPWSFATKRTALASLVLDANVTQWSYVYAKPADALDILSVLPSDSSDDYNGSRSYVNQDVLTTVVTSYSPQTFSSEVSAVGANVIYTNQETAVCRYISYLTDTTKFPPAFVMALSYNLAALLAGPVIKGDIAANQAMRCLALADVWMKKAIDVDSKQRKANVSHNVPWISGR